MSTYSLQTANAFFRVMSGVVASEIRPGNTATFCHTVDLSQIESIRQAAEKGQRPSYTSFVVKALALALTEFSYANRRLCAGPWPWSRLRLQQFEGADVAVACERNVEGAEAVAFVDVMRDAQSMSLAAVGQWLSALARATEETNEQWRSFRFAIERLPALLARLAFALPWVSPKAWHRYRGGAAMVSSPGKYGVDTVTATWPSPIGVSFGHVKPRAVVIEGAVVARPTTVLTLNFDRRVMAGAQAGRFFHRLVAMLENAKAELSGPVPVPVAAAAANSEAPSEENRQCT